MNNKKPPRILSLAILTVITVFAWIGFDVYRALMTKPAPEVPSEILSPISPQLDIELLSSLEQRVFEVPKTGIQSTPVPTSIPSSSPTPSP